MYINFYKLAKRLLLTDDLEIRGVGFYFSEELGFGTFAQLVIQIHGDFLHKVLIVMIPHHFLDFLSCLKILLSRLAKRLPNTVENRQILARPNNTHPQVEQLLEVWDIRFDFAFYWVGLCAYGRGKRQI